MADCGKIIENSAAKNKNGNQIKIYAQQNTRITDKRRQDNIGEKTGYKNCIVIFAFHAGAHTAKNGIHCRHQRYGKQTGIFKRHIQGKIPSGYKADYNTGECVEHIIYPPLPFPDLLRLPEHIQKYGGL